MKALAVIRKIDPLGRLVLPMELRKALEIEVGDPLEVFINGPKILLKKCNPACTFCQEAESTITFKGKIICNSCYENLKRK